MNETKPLFIADSCVGGLSVLKSIRASGSGQNVVFLADYAVNPLGVKSDELIREVVFQWLSQAAAVADTLVIGCNTLSIRYEQLRLGTSIDGGPARVISMVDCFKAMLENESARLSDKRVLIIGTRFTANQRVYPDLLREHCAGVAVSTIAATELERSIARLEPWSAEDDSVITHALRAALAETEVAVLACTCFPMARSELEQQFPGVLFLDPGSYCPRLLEAPSAAQEQHLDLLVTGDAVAKERVLAFAEGYLPTR
jgi:glutamate racemase